MSYTIKSTWFLLLLAPLLVACATPAMTTPAPEPTRPVPTQTASTSVPSIPGEQVTISVTEDNETFNATVTGNGDIGIILDDTSGYDPLRWLRLIDALKGNENLRMITFAYRDEDATPNQDTRAVFDYLRAEGIDKIICVGAGYGAGACGYLQAEPEIVGMVLFASFGGPAIETSFPKLFLTVTSDPHTAATSRTQLMYEQSAEPKVFKSYEAGVHGPAIFAKADVGPQVLSDITEFIDEVVSSQ